MENARNGNGIRKVIKTEIDLGKVAEKIASEYTLIFCAGNFYVYREGCYYLVETGAINQLISRILKDNFTIQKAREVVAKLEADRFIKQKELNSTELLNLKNGMLNLKTGELFQHSPDIYSTIQLDVTYNQNATCENWIRTLNEIFEDNQGKIRLFQEFCGLCLTKEVKYHKALFCIGEGANGKSTLLNVLMRILGRDNYTSIPLEKFQDFHYIANLFGKLANISIETNAKSSVYDSVFKAIVTGDSLTADRKYKRPITFNPFCKLILAVNNMPRVDDKTAAFFRRLLILRFNRQFAEEEQNKNLINELLEELDGIFLWCLEGLSRLRQRNYFDVDASMRQEIDEYKRENNNVLLFVDEECMFRIDLAVTKKELYIAYKDWCKENGHRELSKNKFGKELRKQYTAVKEDRISGDRYWIGIGLADLVPPSEQV